MKQVQTTKRRIFITINNEINDEMINAAKKFVEEIKDKFPSCEANFFVAASIESDPTEDRPNP